ncbi:Protein of unknown function [Gryllus bimaculatus]|nr:Protein of unknown function [Gryllus bimaculatus]
MVLSAIMTIVKINLTSTAWNSQTKSYAGAATDVFPTKDQAMIIEAHERLTLKDNRESRYSIETFYPKVLRDG